MKKFIAKYPIICFFILTIAWSGGIWILLIPSVQQSLNLNNNSSWQWLSLAGPGLSAIFISTLIGGTEELIKLFKPLLRWRVSINYYAFVFLGVFFFYCAASWLTLSLHKNVRLHDWLWLLQNTKAPFTGLTGIWFLIETTIIYTFCEELGWRGFALPKLAKQINVLYAALLIGIIWTVWHIPLVYLNGSHLTLPTFAIYLLHIICMSIIYAWLYFKTDQSLLLVGLLHGTTDGLGAYFPIITSTIGQGPNLPTLVMEIFIAALMMPYLWKVNIFKLKG